jgi:hypothetical protein
MFHPPTDYYCEVLAPIDEQLCSLIAKRKEVSGNNPGFPGVDRISGWCQHYGLNEQMTLHVFGQLYGEDHFQPRPVPTGFSRFIPIAKFVKLDGVVYAVTHVKQYTNMSVVNIEISLETDDETVGIMHARVDLSIGPEYTCLQESGGGSGRGMQYSFAVTPPLPDDIAGVEFSLKITPWPDIPKPRAPFILKAVAVTIK